MNLTVRIPIKLESLIRADLARRHRFAAERIGFVFGQHVESAGTRVVLLERYEPVEDEFYIDDPIVGARINGTAIRKVMQRVLGTGECAFHVHLHEHSGIPKLSGVDLREIRPLMRSIRNAAPAATHGLLLLSNDAAYCEGLDVQEDTFVCAERITFVGFPTRIYSATYEDTFSGSRFSRQGFLGSDAERIIASCRVGIVGLGGGGSHIAQQLAHIGFRSYSLFDSDTVEQSNLNRLVGARNADAKEDRPKVTVATEVIRGVNPNATVIQIQDRWQEAPELLRSCDIIFGCVDSFAERRDLEVLARRFLIPYIDIGMDVVQCSREAPRMAGQVILSMPGYLCMSCLGFLTPEKFAREAEQYGAAGPRPQVVWANGVLASSAVGIAVDLLTNWTRSLIGPVYLSYDSNNGTIQPHKRLAYLKEAVCSHFPFCELGKPVFKAL